MQDNLKIITARDLAEARILNGVNGSLNAMGTWVGECFIYMPNGDILVASREHNPLLKLEFAKKRSDQVLIENDENFILMQILLIC